MSVTIVIATRDRAPALASTLVRHEGPVVVVDNGSRDATAAVAAEHGADVIRLGEDRGAAARTIGAEAARTPYVAFADDDSWWAPGALALAARHFEAHGSLGLLAGRVLVGPEDRLDPTSAEMARSPIADGADDLPGRPVLGFVCCGAVVRREAFLDVGGFHPRYGFGGEEDLVALDLAATGWRLRYCEDVVAHHHPSTVREAAGHRRARAVRNDLWTAWLRAPTADGLRSTAAVAARVAHDPEARAGLSAALRGAGWVARARRPVPARVAAARALLRAS